MSDLLELIAKRYAEPDPLPYLFDVGQRVRVLEKVTQDGQTHEIWAGAEAMVVSRRTTGIHKEHWYKLRLIRAGSWRDDFREDELDARYARRRS